MSVREIYADMNDPLGADCIGYLTVTKHLRKKGFSKSMLETDFEPKIEKENFIDEAILGLLEECPFSLLGQIAKTILIPMSMVRYHLVNSLEVSNREHSMGSALALIEPKTSRCRDESRSSSSSPVSQAPCLEIHCYTERHLV
jgi:hypothetical protein